MLTKGLFNRLYALSGVVRLDSLTRRNIRWFD